MHATKISYEYRSAGGYGMQGNAVLAGEITPEEKEIILQKLENGEVFIPSQVGLSDLQEIYFEEHGFSWDDDEDHVWHILKSIQLTDEKPTESMDVHELVRRFKEVEWDVTEVLRRLSPDIY